MEIEFTSRQIRINKTAQDAAREGIARLARMLGPLTAAACIVSGERHLQRFEIHLKSRKFQLVAHGSSTTQASALRLALEHAESQALRFRDRLRTRKRKPAPEAAVADAMTGGPVKIADKKASVAKKPSRRNPELAVIPTGRKVIREPHLVSAVEAVQPHPLTMEQAVKKAESEDRDLLIFRTAEGTQFVLHRRRDGQMAMVALA